MLLIKTTPTIILITLFVLTACAPTDEFSSAIASATASAQPIPTQIKLLPTPSSPGDSVTWRNLQVSMGEVEITDSFINEFGSQRRPSSGTRFLWIHVALENVGNEEVLLPEPENFSALYAESEFKPIYGHRQGHTDYTDLGTRLFPGENLDAWLRFDIPDTAELKDVWFVFLPTSAQVGVSPSSPNYPYAENKPTFVWKCEP